MASLKNIYSLSQPSPAKAAGGTPFLGANEPNLHHYSLSHHPFLLNTTKYLDYFFLIKSNTDLHFE